VPPSISLLKYPFRTVDGKDPLLALLIRLLSENKKVCFIAPSERRADFIKSEITTDKFSAYSPDSLALKLLGRTGNKLISEEHRTLFLISLLDSNPALSGFFGKTPGTLSILLDLINDLKLSLHHRNLPALRKTISEHLAGSDRVLERSMAAAEILDVYCKELTVAGVSDKADLPMLAAAAVSSEDVVFEQVVFDGFYDLPPAQKEFFTAIINKSSGVTAVIRQTAEQETRDAGENEFYAFTKEFKGAKEVAALKGAAPRFPSGVKVAKTMSREDEVRWQAAEIVKLTKEGKVDPKEITVTFPSMYAYYPYIKRIFGEANIEFNSSFEYDLATFPQVSAVVNLLECVLEDYPRRRLTEAVTSPLFTAFSTEAKEVIACASRDAGIISGAAKWAQFSANLNKKSVRGRFYSDKSEEVKRVGEEINIFIERSKPAQEMTLSEFADYVRAMLKLAGCAFGGKGPLLAFESLLASVGSYSGSGAGKKQTFSYLCRVFIDMLKKAKYGPKGEISGVKVLGILETRGVEARHIFFGGLNDGEFPLRPKQEMVVPDRLRKKLGLTSFEKRIALQRFHFYRLLETPLEDIHLSYPVQDSSRLLLPSNFLPAELPGFTLSPNKEPAGGPQKPREKETGTSVAAFPEKVLKAFAPEMFISVTAFDAYIKCPHSFYLEKILKLRPFEEPSYEVAGADYGSIMHDSMEAAVVEGEKTSEGLKKLLKDALETRLLEESFPSFWKDFIRQKVEVAAFAIGKQEEALSAEYAYVLYTEKALSGELIPEVLKVKGRVDRVDCSGRDLLVIDYKTGSLAGIAAGQTSRFESLQLPLYAALLEKEYPQYKVKELAVFDLTAGKLKKVRTETIGEMISEAVSKAGRIIESVRKGEFPRNRSEKCRFCGYAGSCAGTDSY